MEKKLIDFQPDWEKLVDKGFANYDSLTPSERIWFNIEVFLSAVLNGGIIGHYCNYGAENNKETIEDQNSLGLEDISGILLQVNQLFSSGTPPKDGAERNEIISQWPEFEYDDLLEQLDHQFSDRVAEIESKLVDYILRTRMSS